MFEVMILILIIVLMVAFPFFRWIPLHLHEAAFYAPVDVYRYFKYKKWRECPAFGYIKIYTGYFGSGKSLSAVDTVINLYKRYNDLEVWNDDLKAFIKQKITIISNLKLVGVPYIPFISEQQFIDYATAPSEVVIFLIDEIGTVWNNRNFKNFNPDTFQNIVQCRKRRMSIYGTLPVFDGTDINVRRYTNTVITCEKHWRIIKHCHYDAKDLENCNNPQMVQPLCISYRFIRDLMYKQYDTSEMVDKLKQDMVEGKLLTFNELNIVNSDGDIKKARLKKKFRKRQT